MEVGGGSRPIKLILLALAALLLVVGYNWRGYKNMATQEAMDAAQLGRNIAQGEGYTTKFVRPFSIYLVKKTNQQKPGVITAGEFVDFAQIKEAHPDIANPPVYPVILAALMKVLPFDHTASATKPFWSSGGRFWRYQPDFLIALFNQMLFFGVIVLAFFWARRLFDNAVAWTSALLLLGTELLWRFSVSGLSTMLLLLIFMGLVWVLTLLESETREPKWSPGALIGLAIGAGVLVALGGLTRYSVGWLIIPVMLFLILFGGQRRVVLCLAAMVAFAAIMAPWIIRNYQVSGAPFGTATYAVLEGTVLFPDYRLQRSLEPDFSRVFLMPFWQKLMVNLRGIFQNDVPRLGGSWITALFLAGLLVGFRHPTIRRLRYFALFTLGILMLVQALGRTHLSDESPEINSENLLVLLVPLVLIYGVSLFFVLLDQINLPVPEFRFVIIGAFGVVICLPMIFAFLPPKTNAVAYPPYYPPMIQQTAGWMKENEMMMSDIPWAVAWYGNRQCVWLTLNAQSEFFAINDFQKPITALYLTPQTMDSKFLSQWVRAGEHSWGSFILESLVKREVPPSFPLREAPSGFLPEQLFLTDRQRWRLTE